MAEYLKTLGGDLVSPRLKRFLSDWAAWRRSREIPSRADLVVEQVRYSIGNIALLDTLYEPLRFRCRLAGTTIVERRRLDLTGKLLDEHPNPDFRAAVIPFNRWVVEERRPLRHEYRIFSDTMRNLIEYEVLNLPLSGDGKHVDMIISAAAFEKEQGG